MSSTGLLRSRPRTEIHCFVPPTGISSELFDAVRRDDPARLTDDGDHCGAGVRLVGLDRLGRTLGCTRLCRRRPRPPRMQPTRGRASRIGNEFLSWMTFASDDWRQTVVNGKVAYCHAPECRSRIPALGPTAAFGALAHVLIHCTRSGRWAVSSMRMVAAPAIKVITAIRQPTATRPRSAARDVETIGEKPPTTAAARP